LVLPGSSEVFLFDVTPDIRQQLDLLADLRSAHAGAVDRSPLAGLFLTHAHIGHYLGLAFFGYEALHTTSLPLWVSPRMAEYLRRNGPWSQLVGFGNVELHELQPETRIELGSGVAVQAFSAPHRDEYADTLGFTITGPNRRLVYLPDTDSWRAWEQPLPQFLSGVDIALLDGTFYAVDELPGRSIESIGHPLMPDTMDLLHELVDKGSLQVYFTHLNHSNPALTPGSEARRTIERRGFRVLDERQEFPL
jgi:pyrroloquinoline quinone biosynthesis protein B